MAKIKIDDIIYELDGEFKKALDDTMAKFAPNVQYDRNELFKFFRSRVYQQCSQWEKVPDSCVQS
jgi:hypothetical protein